MRVIVCGSRTWADADKVSSTLDQLDVSGLTIIQGGARGADRIAGEWADRMNIPVEEYPAQWNTHGRSAGPIRNREMLDLGADLVIAFRSGESRGTDDMIRESRRRGIQVMIVHA